jgi:hypothetical protein
LRGYKKYFGLTAKTIFLKIKTVMGNFRNGTRRADYTDGNHEFETRMQEVH